MGDEDIMMAPESWFRDQAQNDASNRLDEKSFGRKWLVYMGIFKYLKTLILHCPETRQLAQFLLRPQVSPPTKHVYNRI
jgi:hypothetical protein